MEPPQPADEFMSNLRRAVRLHQRHLIEHPDHDDLWWFLVSVPVEHVVGLDDVGPR
jgi:hypothetical protein